MQNFLKKSLIENIRIFKKKIAYEDSFDILSREFEISRKKAALFYIDGFIDDKLIFVLDSLMTTKDNSIIKVNLKKIREKLLTYFEISVIDNFEEANSILLAGSQLLFLEGENKALVIDGRSWLTRSPEEPELEKSTRGPADGFVETMLFNVTAIRRRIRDVNFRAEVLTIGKRSKNDIALVYIDDIVNKELLNRIKSKLDSINIDGLPLGDKSVEEIITGGSINPLPLVRYTERPDNVAAHILEGNLAIIVDNSPTALILPAPFFSHLQTLEIYRKGVINGSYLSFIRVLAVFITLFLPAIWLLAVYNKEYLPSSLYFIGVKEESSIGLGLQFVLASLGIDLIRMASIQTPSTLATSLSLVGALLLGDFAVKVGVFSPEVVLYMAIAALANFSIPGYELALSLKLFRLLILLAVIIADIWGFIVITTLIFIFFVFSKSFGVYYLWPLIPFDYKALKSYILRQSIMDLSQKRPSAYKTKDSDRMDKNDKKEGGK
ncbi:MAG: spore germination protein [Bacillota bacterium]